MRETAPAPRRSEPCRARARAARASAAAWARPPGPAGSLAERSACASATVSGNAPSPSTMRGARSIAPTTARRSSRSGSSNATARACANSPRFAESLQYPRRAAGDGRGTRTAVRTSPSPRVVANGPRMKEGSGSARAPAGPSIQTSAPSAASTTGQSAAGSAWARLPPMVPRLRIARYAMFRAARRSHPGLGSGTSPSSISPWVMAAPQTTSSEVSIYRRRSAHSRMSMRRTGRARRRLSIGPRDCPPAMSRLPGLAASISTACAVERARA